MARRIFTEAIHVEGADFIGTAKGYDLFDILTYDAAQQFVNASSNASAGADYTQNASTFNSNVNQNLHLYFFVAENTNRVRYAVIKGRGTDNQSLVIFNMNGGNVDLTVNFAVENTDHQSIIAADDTVPLFLLPNIDIEEAVGRDGCYFSDDRLVAVLPQFCDVDSLQIDHLPNHIRFINDDAFYYGQEISWLSLSGNIENLGANVISNKVHEIHVIRMLEAPESWNSNWNADYEDRTHFGYGLSDEDRAAIEAEVAERERQAAELRRAEEERLAREAQIAADREARKIRYKVEGDSITIKGTRKGITELDIPPEIEGKPVTKIEAYAFFGNKDLTRIGLPNTLKLIERGAFYDMYKLSRKAVAPKHCIIGKDNPFVVKSRN